MGCSKSKAIENDAPTKDDSNKEKKDDSKEEPKEDENKEEQKEDKNKELTEYAIKEVIKHNTTDSAWIIINNKIYDVTNFKLLIDLAGKDVTKEFNSIKEGKGHPTGEMIEKFMSSMCIGVKLPEYTMEDVMEHNTEDSKWIVINDKIYDVTDFKDHPGGHHIFAFYAGKDVTQILRREDELFKEGHPHGEMVEKLMKSMCVGVLKPSESEIIQMDEMSKFLDKYGDKILTEKELTKAIMSGEISQEESYLLRRFNYFEMIQFFKDPERHFGYWRWDVGEFIDRDMFEIILHKNIWLTLEQIREKMNKYDVREDGKITCADFLKMFPDFYKYVFDFDSHKETQKNMVSLEAIGFC